MKQYFQVVLKVEKETEDNKGRVKIKTVRESYLIEAVNPTEAEAKIHQQLKGSMESFEVVAISLTKYLDVI